MGLTRQGTWFLISLGICLFIFALLMVLVVYMVLQYGGTCKCTRPTSTVNIIIIIALVYKIRGKYKKIKYETMELVSSRVRSGWY